ncbi:hypothetical protein LEP1GSC120_0364 [Leptospira santarosai str. 200702252]|nr:hypothetical protein LEP1GSC068_0949 [Leptospira sp. Fiocruz LV3954]EMI69943.1 hypothetical protein LEP1GSC076_0563 [Leptospira sp. Fiocruz LV4135]EMO73139.1 hypothetical protein LEP1GSC130_2420 [Leptospira santarosai str. 200403458]EMO96599.1 hypothetical protein LEP1GSC120_0364 [Leptospira santarosai str. 200702252]
MGTPAFQTVQVQTNTQTAYCFDFENVGVPTFCFHEKMNVSEGKRRTHANLVHSKTQIY